MRRLHSVVSCLALFTIAGCSNPASPSTAIKESDAQVPSSSDRYLPLSVGARWTYDTTDTATSQSGATESVVEALEDVGGAKAGIKAYRVRSTAITKNVVNWQQDAGTSVVRHREQFYDLSNQLTSDYVFMPNRLRLDESPEHLVKGATWTETNSATLTSASLGATQTVNFTVQWTVDSVDETVTVKAGTFSCLRVHRVESGYANTDETFWFARHVGKVKETGSEETATLASYSIP